MTEIRYTIEGWELKLGENVWTRKTDGIGYPLLLQLRRARKDCHCRDCGERIEKGAMHGSGFYEHHCGNCVIPYHHKPQEKYEE